MKNFYIGKVIMFQTDICFVLDQMIEGGGRGRGRGGSESAARKTEGGGWEIQNMENAARAT